MGVETEEGSFVFLANTSGLIGRNPKTQHLADNALFRPLHIEAKPVPGRHGLQLRSCDLHNIIYIIQSHNTQKSEILAFPLARTQKVFYIIFYAPHFSDFCLS